MKTNKLCLYCEGSMQGKRSNAIYCSIKCKEKARDQRRTQSGHWETDKEKNRCKKYRDNNPGQARARGIRYAQNNKGKMNAKKALRRARQHKATPKWADKDAIKRMYIISQFLTDKLGEPHHVDHIVPLRGEKVCGFHCENNLQVITAEDNLKKGNTFYG